jgi:hypothetical protein
VSSSDDTRFKLASDAFHWCLDPEPGFVKKAGYAILFFNLDSAPRLPAEIRQLNLLMVKN